MLTGGRANQSEITITTLNFKNLKLMNRKLQNIIELAFLLLLAACSRDCEECFTPPTPFVFEIVDATTGENLFSNGTYAPEQIKIILEGSAGNAGYSFLSENDINLLQINGIGWKTETVSLWITASTDTLFSLKVSARRETVECCSFTQFTDVQIGWSDFAYNPESGIYLVSVVPRRL